MSVFHTEDTEGTHMQTITGRFKCSLMLQKENTCIKSRLTLFEFEDQRKIYLFVFWETCDYFLQPLKSSTKWNKYDI